MKRKLFLGMLMAFGALVMLPSCDKGDDEVDGTPEPSLENPYLHFYAAKYTTDAQWGVEWGDPVEFETDATTAVELQWEGSNDNCEFLVKIESNFAWKAAVPDWLNYGNGLSYKESLEYYHIYMAQPAENKEGDIVFTPASANSDVSYTLHVTVKGSGKTDGSGEEGPVFAWDESRPVMAMHIYYDAKGQNTDTSNSPTGYLKVTKGTTPVAYYFTKVDGAWKAVTPDWVSFNPLWLVDDDNSGYDIYACGAGEVSANKGAEREAAVAYVSAEYQKYVSSAEDLLDPTGQFIGVGLPHFSHHTIHQAAYEPGEPVTVLGLSDYGDYVTFDKYTPAGSWENFGTPAGYYKMTFFEEPGMSINLNLDFYYSKFELYDANGNNTPYYTYDKATASATGELNWLTFAQSASSNEFLFYLEMTNESTLVSDGGELTGYVVLYSEDSDSPYAVIKCEFKEEKGDDDGTMLVEFKFPVGEDMNDRTGDATLVKNDNTHYTVTYRNSEETSAWYLYVPDGYSAVATSDNYDWLDVFDMTGFGVYQGIDYTNVFSVSIEEEVSSGSEGEVIVYDSENNPKFYLTVKVAW